MRILLVGEYSNVFNTLSEGLNKLGHECLVASSGDDWKDYSRDIDLKFESNKKRLQYIFKNLKLFKNFDIVQIVNPLFIFSGSSKSIKLNYYFFKYLMTYNKRVFMSAIGDDYFWVKACLENRFKYTPFDFYDIPYPESHFNRAKSYYEPQLKRINLKMIQKSDGIIAGLYEYYRSYDITDYRQRLSFIPFPIDIDSIKYSIQEKGPNDKIKFFIGIQKNRLLWKGQDLLLEEIKRCKNKYPNDLDLDIAVSVPFSKYHKMMDSTDFVIDQLYSYSPAMNALTAMAKAKVLIGGGENEMYELLGEKKNKPIINVIPDRKQIQSQFEYILDNRDNINKWKTDSRHFVEQHHNYLEVAQKYIETWQLPDYDEYSL